VLKDEGMWSGRTWVRVWTLLVLTALVLAVLIEATVAHPNFPNHEELAPYWIPVIMPGLIISTLLSGNIHGGFHGLVGDAVEVAGSALVWSTIFTLAWGVVRRIARRSSLSQREGSGKQP